MRQRKAMSSSSEYLSTGQLAVFFGLGDAEKADAVFVQGLRNNDMVYTGHRHNALLGKPRNATISPGFFVCRAGDFYGARMFGVEVGRVVIIVLNLSLFK